MKIRTVFKCAAAVAPLGAMVAVWLLRGGNAQLAGENQSLREQAQEAERLAQENEHLASLRTNTAALEALRQEAKAVDKIRAEVWRLRPQAKERDRLLAENQHLAALPKWTNAAGPRLADMPGYLPAASFADAGLATPEDALQTFLRAIQAGDWKRIFDCLPEEEVNQLREQLNGKPEQERAKAAEEMLALFRMKGYRIAAKETLSDDRVVLKIQTTSGSGPHPITLQKSGTVWKLSF